jgi:hypothetical protein
MLIKVNVELLNSAVVAWSKSKQAAREEVRPAIKRNIFDPDRTAVRDKLGAIIAEKVSKYKANFPGVDIISPKSATVRSRVLRFENDPVAHDLKVSNPGPTTLLEAPELVLVRLIEEMAEGGLYMNGEQLCARMAAIIADTPVGDSFAELAAKSRGEKDAAGELIFKPQDFLPGLRWKKNFLARHADRLSSTLPVALDKTRELWQTVDNFAFWYLCLERFFVKYGFATVAPE